MMQDIIVSIIRQLSSESINQGCFPVVHISRLYFLLVDGDLDLQFAHWQLLVLPVVLSYLLVQRLEFLSRNQDILDLLFLDKVLQFDYITP